MGTLKYWISIFALFVTACGVTQTQLPVIRSITVTSTPPTATPQIVEVTRIVKVEQTVVVTVTPVPLLAQKCFDKAITQFDLNGCAAEERGTGGFGYDPIFLLTELSRTMAELTMDEKNRLSHRARAVMKAKPILEILCSQPD